MVLVFAINANAEDQKRKKGFREKGMGRRKGKNGRTLGKPYPHDRKGEREERRGTKRRTNDIQRNAVIWTVPGSSYSEENHQRGGKPYLWG